MNFDNYIFRSHMVGNIISVPKPLTPNQAEMLEDYRKRVKGEGRPLTDNQVKTWHSLEHKHNESQTYKLTDTAKRICTDLVFEARTGRRSKLETKYFDKGIEKEKDARDLVSEVLGRPFTKDDERRANSWVTGKRDIQDDNLIIDIKTSWSFESFNKHLLDTPNEVYLRQLGASSVDWQVRVWCRPVDYWDVRERLTGAAKEALERHGIGIPFPQLDVHVVGKVLARAAA